MAIAGTIIENKVAGFKLQWIQTSKDTGGAFVKCRMWLAPNAYMPVRHLHPNQTETFEIAFGRLKIESDKSIQVISEGESFTVPRGKPHQWWNESTTDQLEMLVTMTPAKNWERQMEQVFGIMNAKGKLSFLQIMIMLREYEMYIAGPPTFVQKLLSTILYPIARLRGLKKYYPEYGG